MLWGAYAQKKGAYIDKVSIRIFFSKYGFWASR
jgi:hypothetical protein